MDISLENTNYSQNTKLSFIVSHKNLSQIVENELFHEFSHSIVLTNTNVELIININENTNYLKLHKFIKEFASVLNIQ
jgi:hypothetical protein